MRDVVQDVARDWSTRVGDAMYYGHEGALKAMVERGKTQNRPVSVTELPARQLLFAYMGTMRKRGAKPVRERDK